MQPILPGATIGILGGGQLGRMTAIAARHMGYRVAIFSPEVAPPAAAVADTHTAADYTDLAALEAFARQCDVITYEFEGVPAAAAAHAHSVTPVRPGPDVLAVTQHRAREKSFLASVAVPTVSFAVICSEADLFAALRTIGLPAILKTVTGYDGKGQAAVASPDDALTAWRALAAHPSSAVILERRVELAAECSVLIARTAAGRAVTYGPFENAHANHILDTTVFPARLPPSTADLARAYARITADRLAVTGLLCVEFFLTVAGELLVNELAPRPHNSGHLTIEAFATSQFENHVRSVCGLPLGDPSPVVPAAAMANLLGDLWLAPQGGEFGSPTPGGAPRPSQPDFVSALATPGVHLHLYGKPAPGPGRRMGHLVALAPTPATALAAVTTARAAMRPVSRPAGGACSSCA